VLEQGAAGCHWPRCWHWFFKQTLHGKDAAAGGNGSKQTRVAQKSTSIPPLAPAFPLLPDLLRPAAAEAPAKMTAAGPAAVALAVDGAKSSAAAGAVADDAAPAAAAGSALAVGGTIEGASPRHPAENSSRRTSGVMAWCWCVPISSRMPVFCSAVRSPL